MNDSGPYSEASLRLRRYVKSYWPMPNSFVEDRHLRRLWRNEAGGGDGGRAAVALLPIIGTHVHTLKDGYYWSGQADMGQLAGVSVGSVRAAGKALAVNGIGEVRQGHTPNGLPVSKWTLSGLAMAQPDSGNGYFSFPARAVWGGNWGVLTPVQRALYLAVGSLVRTHESPEATADMLLTVLTQPQVEEILSRPGRLMIAFASLSTLSSLTGISRSALIKAIADFPTGSTALLDSYPTRGNGERLFVVRDRGAFETVIPCPDLEESGLALKGRMLRTASSTLPPPTAAPADVPKPSGGSAGHNFGPWPQNWNVTTCAQDDPGRCIPPILTNPARVARLIGNGYHQCHKPANGHPGRPATRSANWG